jgi:hypothetical protein
MTEKIKQKKTGIVAGVNQNQGKYGLTLEDGKTWYNGIGECPYVKGDSIAMTYTINGQWNNIEQVYKLEEPQLIENYTKIKTFSQFKLEDLEIELNNFGSKNKVIATQAYLNMNLYDAIVYYK